MTVKVLDTQLCPTVCDAMDHRSPPGSSVHGILQARILEWVAFPFSREFSQPRSPALQVDSLLSESHGVLIKRGNLDTDRYAEREDDVKRQGEDDHLQAQERNLKHSLQKEPTPLAP